MSRLSLPLPGRIHRALPLALAALLACDGGGGPTALLPDPVPGPGDYTRQIRSGGLDRSYELHVPAGWTTGTESPLVLAFHGLLSSPANLQAVSGLDPVADDLGVVVAYPGAAVSGDWNTGCGDCGSDAVLDEVDDLGFVADLIEQLDADVGIDRRRVYAIGISNGALFVHRLACAAQDRIAAAASVAATLIAPEYVPACADHALPITFYLGSEDTFFPPEGRLAGNDFLFVRLTSIQESISAWVERDGCAPAPSITDLPDVIDDGTTVRRLRYQGCDDGAEVVYYEIQGGGHTWPGSSLGAGGVAGRVSRDVSASDTAVRFFLEHVR